MHRETRTNADFRPVRPVATDDTGMITALFRSRHAAEDAFKFLRDRGYEERDVNVLMSEETRKHQFLLGPETELGNKAAKGAGVGAGIGGALGAIAAAVATVTAVAVPGLGVVVAGPLAAALAGAGAGGAAGGLIGALIGAGIPEERVKNYESGLKSGGILLGVHPRTPEEALEIRHYWAKHGEHVYQ
jgi:hypothetical protein